MKLNNIYFSIIICCYNSDKYLREALESVISQSYKNWEIVIVDDGSTDKTEEIINSYINNERDINYIKLKQNKGYANARNQAVKFSKYDWVVILDHDDIFEKNKLEIIHQKIIKNIDIKVIFSDCLYFDKNKFYESRIDLLKKLKKIPLNNLSFSNIKLINNLLKFGCFIISSSFIFKKECFESVSGFNNNLMIIADYEFFLKLSSKFNFIFIDKKLVKWRLHSSQTTNLYNEKYYKELSVLLIKSLFYSNIKIITKIYVIIRSFYYLMKYFKIKYIKL